MDHAALLNVVKDLIVAASAATGAIVAVKGLSTWRKQLKGQNEYELSRRILVTLFRYRDAINGVRHPAMWSNEMPRPDEEKAKAMTQEQLRHHGLAQGYENRWSKVQEQRVNLYPDLLEAEVLWGDNLKILFQDINKLQHELMICIRHYLEVLDPDTDQDTKDAVQGIRNNERDIMYDNLSDEGDEFKKDLLEAIKKVEDYLKPKLRQENA